MGVFKPRGTWARMGELAKSNPSPERVPFAPCAGMETEPASLSLSPLDEQLRIDELLSAIREQCSVLREQNSAFCEYVRESQRSAARAERVSLASLGVALASLTVAALSLVM